MPRYIDADELKWRYIPLTIQPEEFVTKSDVENAPTADVVERRSGRWQICSILDYAQRPTGRKVGRCPFCEFLTGEFRTLIECNRELTNFCPNCGADMNGRIEE